MFSSLMPQRNEFFELLSAHSDRVVAGANATLRLLNGLGQGTEDIPVLVAEVNMNEQSADKIKAELITLLHRSFTTPINRDQIHTLNIELDLVLNALQDVANVNETSADRIKAEFIKLLYEAFTTPVSRDQLHTLILDRVLETLQSAANAITMYNIVDSPPAAQALASLGADACLRLNRAVVALADRNGGAVILAQCHDIDALEDRASTTMREAVTQLFQHEGDEQAAWHAVKMRRFHFTQLAVLDGCRRAAESIDEILLENA